MIEDHKKGSQYEFNSLRQDKLLWIAREYQKQGIEYVEMADTELAKLGEPAHIFPRFPSVESATIPETLLMSWK